MVGKALRGVFIAALFAVPVLINADTLIIEGLDQSEISASQRPARGMTMANVEANWGQPLSKRNAVGDPPITRWEYTNFVLYFEYQHVIHAVTKN